MGRNERVEGRNKLSIKRFRDFKVKGFFSDGKSHTNLSLSSTAAHQMKRSKPSDTAKRDSKNSKVDSTNGHFEPSSNLQSSVLLSTRDKSSRLSLSKCQLTCTGCEVCNQLLVIKFFHVIVSIMISIHSIINY